MGVFGTSNSSISQQIEAQGAANFKATNNLLTLQTNHVEEFFEYHGEGFLYALEKMLEDMTERVVSRMLSKLRFTQGASGELVVHSDCLREYETITQENIQLDVQAILAAAINTEVVMQRKMAKDGKIVMVGRDIASVVLPTADLKIFLTASAANRAKRRYE